MTDAEHVEKLDAAIRKMELAQKAVEAANTKMNEVRQEVATLLGGSASMDIAAVKDEAYRKIGQLMLAQRRMS